MAFRYTHPSSSTGSLDGSHPTGTATSDSEPSTGSAQRRMSGQSSSAGDTTSSSSTSSSSSNSTGLLGGMLSAILEGSRRASSTGYLPLHTLSNASSPSPSPRSYAKEDLYPDPSNTRASSPTFNSRFPFSSSTSSYPSEKGGQTPLLPAQTSSPHGSSPSTTSGRRWQWYCYVFFAAHVAILVLAVLGLTGIVAFATGLIQKTPILSQRELQDSGWTRRPIILADDSLSGIEQAQHASQRVLENTNRQLVTIHDFSPSPLAEDSFLAEASSSSKSSENRPTISRSHSAALPPVEASSLHLLILCPMRNSAKDLPHFFDQLDGMTHPKQNTSLGFLIGDEDDDTGEVLHRMVEERMGREPESRFRHVTMLHKDFNVEMPSGSARHTYVLQAQRRTVMARARTYLLTATLEPTVDWVLWLDSDIAEFSPSLFEDLLVYGKGGVIDSHGLQSPSSSPEGTIEPEEWNDVIVPNAMQRLPDGQLHPFDMNNWAETYESRKLRSNLAPEDLLIEGNIWQHMHRQHLASSYVPPSLLSSPPLFSLSSPPPHSSLYASTLYNASSPAYIGALMEMDGIGGVAALVRAEVHRMGATFPSWVYENQLETEAFGVLAKKLGARVVGLKNLFVLHRL